MSWQIIISTRPDGEQLDGNRPSGGFCHEFMSLEAADGEAKRTVVTDTAAALQPGPTGRTHNVNYVTTLV